MMSTPSATALSMAFARSEVLQLARVSPGRSQHALYTATRARGAIPSMPPMSVPNMDACTRLPAAVVAVCVPCPSASRGELVRQQFHWIPFAGPTDHDSFSPETPGHGRLIVDGHHTSQPLEGPQVAVWLWVLFGLGAALPLLYSGFESTWLDALRTNRADRGAAR